MWARSIGIVRRCWCWWDSSIDDLNVCATGPHLISFLAIPPPAQDVGTRLVRHVDLVHDGELVLASVCWAQVSLGEFIKAWLELCSCRQSGVALPLCLKV